MAHRAYMSTYTVKAILAKLFALRHWHRGRPERTRGTSGQTTAVRASDRRGHRSHCASASRLAAYCLPRSC